MSRFVRFQGAQRSERGVHVGVFGLVNVLDHHGVAWELVESDAPGRVVYEDEHQVVVVPR